MIYTLTLNPSVDYFVRLNALERGALNRSWESTMNPGGKGINVSRVLKRLGIESRALGLLGGFTGEFIRTELLSEGIATDFTEVDGDTRINVKITAQEETEINGASLPVAEEKLEELVANLDQIKEGDFLVLAGSVPSVLPANIYKTLMTRVKDSGIKVVLDTSGHALKEAVELKPFMMKPNQHELGELFDIKIETQEVALNYGKQLLDKGIHHIIISLGSAGALYLNRGTVIKATVPKGQVHSAVGSGDSLVAGFLAAFSQGKSEAESFKRGVACGTATAFSNGLCDKDLMETILPDIQCEVLEGGEQ